MTNRSSAAKIKLLSVDELFHGYGDAAKPGQEKIVELEIEKLKEYPEHPYQVKDEELTELIDSIRGRGVLEPLRVMAGESDNYVIVSGHRRCRAASLAGKKTVPAYILGNLRKEEADIMMVDSNIYREQILPSEKAYAYKIKIRALRALAEMGMGKVTDVLGEAENVSGKSIQRYIRLTFLVPEILEDVDKGRLAFGTAVNLSYLPRKTQEEIAIEDYYLISLENAEIVKNYFKHSSVMTPELFKEIKAGKLTRNDRQCFEEISRQIVRYEWKGDEHGLDGGVNSLKTHLLQLAQEQCLPSDLRLDGEGVLFAGHKHIKWDKIFENVLLLISSCTEMPEKRKKLKENKPDAGGKPVRGEGKSQYSMNVHNSEAFPDSTPDREFLIREKKANANEKEILRDGEFIGKCDFCGEEKKLGESTPFHGFYCEDCLQMNIDHDQGALKKLKLGG